MLTTAAIVALLAPYSLAFPYVAQSLGAEKRAAKGDEGFGRSYGNHAYLDRRGAVPLSSEFSYNGATNGLPSQGKGECSPYNMNVC
jgi:hypothetical protein